MGLIDSREYEDFAIPPSQAAKGESVSSADNIHSLICKFQPESTRLAPERSSYLLQIDSQCG
jgi:hypothetical protein